MLFALGHDEFAVDTHVLEISKQLVSRQQPVAAGSAGSSARLCVACFVTLSERDRLDCGFIVVV